MRESLLYSLLIKHDQILVIKLFYLALGQHKLL